MDRMSFEAVIGKARERIPTDRIGHWYWRGLSKVGDSGNVKVTFRREPADGIVDTKTVVVENVRLAATGDFEEEQDELLFGAEELEAPPFDHEQDVRPADERPVVPNYAEEE